MLRIRLMCATLKGISHREVLNAASREANGIKMLQRTRDSSQKAIRRLPPTGLPSALLAWNNRPLAAVKEMPNASAVSLETRDFEGWGCRADQRNYLRRA